MSGSHRIPPLLDPTALGVVADSDEAYCAYEEYVDTLVRGSRLETTTIEVAKGPAVIWSANVPHGGSAILDPDSTRRSQVTHYFFPGVTYHTPLLSDVFAGGIHFRTKELVDIRTGEPIQHYYKGNPFDPRPATGEKVRPAAQGGGVQPLSSAAKARKLVDEYVLPPAASRYVRRALARRRG